MSAPVRTSRSRSKTAPDPAADESTSMSVDASLTRRSPSRPPQSPLSSPPPSLPPTENAPDTSTELRATLLDPLPAAAAPNGRPLLSVELDPDLDRADNRSNADTSSLSELVDGSDAHSDQLSDEDDRLPAPAASYHAEENDSEAETERLVTTPQKQSPTKSRAVEITEAVTKTPSKLVHTVLANEIESETGSPANSGEDADDHSLSLQASTVNASDAGSLAGSQNRKRKRSSIDANVIDEPTPDQPAKKRGNSSKDTAASNKDALKSENAVPEPSVETPQNPADKPDPKPEDQDVVMETEEHVETFVEAQEVVEEVVEEAPLASRTQRSRRGKKKGRKAMEMAERASGTPHPADGPDEEDGHAELNEEESAAIEEEVNRKKNAIDDLSKIEKKFKIFREKFCDESIAHIDRVLQALQHTSPPLPEFHTMMRCVDERRDEKIALEEKLYMYKKKCLENKIIAERHQLHSQFFQTVRDLRDRSMEQCNKRLYQLQKERRRTGVEEIEYAYLFPEKRADQILQHNAVVKEVSLLSGIARHIGFPAAPEVRGANRSEIDDDFKAMNLQTRQRPTIPQALAEPSRDDRTAAAEAERAFFESTPWANPQHPAHQGQFSAVPTPQPRLTSNPLTTPAGQRRPIDAQALNGSASTIEMASNPPSSAAGHGANSIERSRHGNADYESPILQMKRASVPEQRPHSTRPAPSSQPRMLAESLKDDPFSSSPPPASKAQEARVWSTAAPSQNEPGRVPFGQRGTPISVAAAAGGGGGGAFGR